MRCLSEITVPAQKSGRDLYGHLASWSRISSNGKNIAKLSDSGNKGSERESEEGRVRAALGQLDVVRYALTQNLSRCFMRQ